MQLDITGQKFYRLTAIKFIERRNDNYYWLFKCDCGKETVAGKSGVKYGHTKSCGCLQKELLKTGQKRLCKLHTTHGMRHTRFYTIWQGMKKRCFGKKSTGYPIYGGRGIKVCDKWLEFINFRDDMYQSYLEHVKTFGEKDTTIDRFPDKNGNYEVANCRWATYSEQNKNRRCCKELLPLDKCF